MTQNKGEQFANKRRSNIIQPRSIDGVHILVIHASEICLRFFFYCSALSHYLFQMVTFFHITKDWCVCEGFVCVH